MKHSEKVNKIVAELINNLNHSETWRWQHHVVGMFIFCERREAVRVIME